MKTVINLSLLVLILVIRISNSAPSTYTIKSSSVCYGSDPHCTRHALGCGEVTSVIGIFQGVYGFKATGSFCRDVSACSTVNSETCCSKQKGDCEAVFRPNDIETLYNNCSGQATCAFNAPRLTAKCSTHTYRSISVFADVKYTCVKDTQIVSLGDRKTIIGDQVYVQYQPTKLETGADIVECQCLIDSRNRTSVDIDVFALDIRLNSTQEPLCSSVSFIKNGDVLRDMSCRTRLFYHSFEYLLRTSTPLRAKVVISKTSLPKNIWFGFRGLNGDVSLSCSYLSQFIETADHITTPREVTPAVLTSRSLDHLFIPTSTKPTTTQHEAPATTRIISSSLPTGRVIIENNFTTHSYNITLNDSRSEDNITITTTTLPYPNITADIGNTSIISDVQNITNDVNNITNDVNNVTNDANYNKNDVAMDNHDLNYDLEKATDKIYETVIIIGSIFGASVVLTSCIVTIYCYLHRRPRDKNEMSEIFQIEDEDRAAFHAYHVIDPACVTNSDTDSKEFVTSRDFSTQFMNSVDIEYSQIDATDVASENIYATPHRIIDLDKLRQNDQFLTTDNDYFDLETDTTQSNTNDVISGYVSDDGYSHLNRHHIVSRTGNDYDSITLGELKSTDL
ncbi:uncharacterized protein LOC126810378 isoform X2 [Patella vulgata]|uniref:uncharacterized protein LOC126810378 isoform X2 n=1 Tax=Patella vulgata TaxID=6465 RepID=UPI0024A9A77B|nr:uncharacterized protein LOC126810378 isoform X2 [Patella vulgata]